MCKLFRTADLNLVCVLAVKIRIFFDGMWKMLCVLSDPYHRWILGVKVMGRLRLFFTATAEREEVESSRFNVFKM